MSTAAKILLIDDDPGITDTLHRVLTEEGHTVVVEKRGDHGLARASQENYNVIITDLRLPGLTGLELVRQLHALQPRLPIILVTAFGTTETAIEAMKFGAYDYLLRVRTELHYHVSRPLDVLGKNLQPAVALGLGYSERSPSRRIERFMRDLYMHLRNIFLITRGVLAAGAIDPRKGLCQARLPISESVALAVGCILACP
jgi:CheY-like chemotaxis protein